MYLYFMENIVTKDKGYRLTECILWSLSQMNDFGLSNLVHFSSTFSIDLASTDVLFTK